MENQYRVYLGRLPYGTREKDVEKFLQGCGKIRDINLKNGFGFVVRSLKCLSLKFSPNFALWFTVHLDILLVLNGNAGAFMLSNAVSTIIAMYVDMLLF